jgi:hypothetical protein
VNGPIFLGEGRFPKKMEFFLIELPDAFFVVLFARGKTKHPQVKATVENRDKTLVHCPN